MCLFNRFPILVPHATQRIGGKPFLSKVYPARMLKSGIRSPFMNAHSEEMLRNPERFREVRKT